MTQLINGAVFGIDPRTGHPVGEPVADTTAADLERALRAAAAAAPAFAASPPGLRIKVLSALADAVDAAADELVPLALAETGLPEGRLRGELARTTAQLRLFAAVVADGRYLDVTIDHADRAAVPPHGDLRRMLVPLGPVLVYAASNFPFAFSVLGGDTASALAAGCPVLVKAHPSHPGLSSATAAVAARAIAAAGAPSGIFFVLFGDEQGVKALADHRVTACGFTGSTAGGRFLARIAADRDVPVPFFGELGSINPAVVTAAALAARAPEIVDGFVASFTLGAGQFCTKPGLLFLPQGHGLYSALRAAVENLAAAPMLNERMASRFGQDAGRLDAAAGVELVGMAGAVEPGSGFWARPRLYTTTAEVLRRNPELITEEHFGPVAVAVEFRDQDDLAAALDVVGGTLTTTLHSEPGEPVGELVNRLAHMSGRVVFNGWPTGVGVTWSMQHGGPWPAATTQQTSVGATAISRWLRPVCFQDAADDVLPMPLRRDNPWRLPRRVDGQINPV